MIQTQCSLLGVRLGAGQKRAGVDGIYYCSLIDIIIKENDHEINL